MHNSFCICISFCTNRNNWYYNVYTFSIRNVNKFLAKEKLIKYCSGDYMLIIFDHTGTKLSTHPHGSYLSAKENSDEYLANSPSHSTAILRVLFNSQQTAEDKWGYNPPKANLNADTSIPTR